MCTCRKNNRTSIRFTAIRPTQVISRASRHLQLRTAGFCWRAKFYCSHALADGNQRIVIREKTLEFSSTVLSTLSPYLKVRVRSKVRERTVDSIQMLQGSKCDIQIW